MNARIALGLIAAIGFSSAGLAQESPLTGRWAFYDYGTRDVPANIIAQDCRDTFDSYAPDGAFVSFARNDDNVLEAILAGMCRQVSSDEVECELMLDADTGIISDVYLDRITIVGPDVIDYAVADEDGKFDEEASWTYFRCPL